MRANLFSYRCAQLPVRTHSYPITAPLSWLQVLARLKILFTPMHCEVYVQGYAMGVCPSRLDGRSVAVSLVEPALEPIAPKPTPEVPPPPRPATTKVFPPPASSTGKRYYVFTLPSQLNDQRPFICCGEVLAKQYLGGTFTARGRAPKGFANLEEAVTCFLAASPAGSEILVRVNYVTEIIVSD